MTNIKRLDSSTDGFTDQLKGLLSAQEDTDDALNQTVSKIIKDVQLRRDEALLEYTNRFDQRQAGIADLKVSRAKIDQAVAQIDETVRQSLEFAAGRIRSYHEKQKSGSWTYEDNDGTLLGQQVTALERVGVYVPGGKAAYPSTVLMNVIPAQVAGVGEIVMTVPAPQDELNITVLAAAGILGIDRIFSIGGAQAIAALAYGTQTVPKVDKIVGPGNRYVTAAKRQVFGAVGIDMIAGPSEVLIISDGCTEPDWLVMDMFAQAEHDEEARVIFISTDDGFIDIVAKRIDELLPAMERADIIKAALQKNSALIKVNDLSKAVEIVNLIAPEHLELAVKDPQKLLPDVRHAGAIFLGHYSAEVLGDYCAGPNHVLPTAQTARFSSPLGVYDFQKRSSVIQCNAGSVLPLAATAAALARSEGLTAHARSAELRMGVKSEE